ncbi:hypothetical protein GCM10023238_36800 [Streptomyces heliomycini]
MPTTFGLRAAGWRQLVLDAEARLARVHEGGLPVSLGGAAGTLAGYLEYAAVGDDGRRPDPGDYLDRLADGTPRDRPRPAVLPWHALRTPVADLAAALPSRPARSARSPSTCSRWSARGRRGRRAGPDGRGSSSAMPHKRNPVLATLLRSAALQVPALAAALTQCLVSEDERSAAPGTRSGSRCASACGWPAARPTRRSSSPKVSRSGPGGMRDNLALTGRPDRLGAAGRPPRPAARQGRGQGADDRGRTGDGQHRPPAGPRCSRPAGPAARGRGRARRPVRPGRLHRSRRRLVDRALRH